MQIKTKYLGEIEISEEMILNFKYGLLGFEDHNEFVLLDIPDNDDFKFLQDINNSYIAFLLINPWDFFKEYDLEIPDEELLKIGIDPAGDNSMAIYNIVTLGETLKDSTSNLLAPILINIGNKNGRQFILTDTHYTTKHNLFLEEIGE